MINKLFNLVHRTRARTGNISGTNSKTSNAEGTHSPAEKILDLPCCIKSKNEHEDSSKIDADYDAFIWDMSQELENDPQINDLINQYENEISAQKTPSSLWHSVKGALRENWGRSFAATAAAFAILAIFLPLMSSPDFVFHETEVGMQKTIKLEDQSVLMLNTNSAVRIAYDDDMRKIYIDRGEVVFTVAKDKNRPFLVHTGAGIVRAIGTEFNIIIDPNDTANIKVSVLEGMVSINDEWSSYQRVILPVLKAGEEVLLAQNIAPEDIKPLDESRISGWRAGQIIFRDVFLTEAIKDHNRYSKVQIVLDSSLLESQKISGTFKIGDTKAIMFALQNLLDIDVKRHNNNIFITKKEA